MLEWDLVNRIQAERQAQKDREARRALDKSKREQLRTARRYRSWERSWVARPWGKANQSLEGIREHPGNGHWRTFGQPRVRKRRQKPSRRARWQWESLGRNRRIIKERIQEWERRLSVTKSKEGLNPEAEEFIPAAQRSAADLPVFSSRPTKLFASGGSRLNPWAAEWKPNTNNSAEAGSHSLWRPFSASKPFTDGQPEREGSKPKQAGEGHSTAQNLSSKGVGLNTRTGLIFHANVLSCQLSAKHLLPLQTPIHSNLLKCLPDSSY